ncbi:MAG: alpha-galactosidase [Chloroflexi bacterium]|nr:alpha-galactosidase [Chloroflexota bacterium]
MKSPSFRIFRTFGVLVVLVSALLQFSAANAQTPTPEPPLGKLIAQSGDAYIAYDATTRTWEIGTAGIRRRMDYDPAAGYRLRSLKHRATNREWLAPGGGASAELRVVIEGKIITSSSREFALKSYSTQNHPDGSVELQVAIANAALVARMHYLAFPGTSVIEQWIEIENISGQALRNLDVLDSISSGLRPSAEVLTLYWVQGVSPGVADRQSVQPVPALRAQSARLDEGSEKVIRSGARSSEEAMGWFVLAAPNLREGLFGGIKWSGLWQLRARREAGLTTLRAGVDQLHYDLAHGEVFQSPRRFQGFYRGGIDDAAFATHTFARGYLLRPLPAGFPYTQYNTWFAYYTDFDEEKLKRQVDIAAALGLEVFVLDAGWYDGAIPGADFSFGLGTWREHREKFPSGLRAFSDYVHSQGMRFGLWVEPERIEVPYVGPGQSVPVAWVSPVTNWDGDLPEGAARTTQICLGNPDARAWMKNWLARLIQDYQVDWLKWDNNIPLSCDPPGVPGYGNYAHILGLYEVLDYLRAEFPHVIIENCASGGNRMDYAMMRRTDIAWLSDETDPSYRVRYHTIGASFPFPPDHLNSFIVESWFEPLSRADSDPALLRAWLRSRMLGAFGISAQMDEWGSEFRATVALEIQRYKSVRDIIVHGRLYHLLPQSDLSLPMLEPPAEPDAIEFFDATSQRGFVLLFRGSVPLTQRRVVLRGLNPNTLYEVNSADGTIALRQTGRQLMSQNITMRYPPEHPSAMLFITPANNAP